MDSAGIEKVVAAEYLVAMWLYAGRAKDYQKIATFLSSGIVDEPALLNILERHDLMIKWNKEKWRFVDEDE